MMRKFEFYEFAAILVPGMIVLVGIVLGWPESGAPCVLDLSVGGFGVGTILAFAAGHLVQAIGNLIEKAWWWTWSGMPTDWIRSSKHSLLAAKQRALVESAARELLSDSEFRFTSDLSKADWYAIVRQIYAAVQRDGRPGRIDTFNSNYGLNRGIAAAFLSLAAILAVVNWPGWAVILLLFGGAAVALCRMHRFGVHYGRELFVQFLASATASSVESAEEDS